MNRFSIASVTKRENISPNMIRIRLKSEDMKSFPRRVEGGHVKLIVPIAGSSEKDLSRLMNSIQVRKRMRTYTVRHLHAQTGEMDIDFVTHGDEGPASAWAISAKIGDVIGLSSPGSPKLKTSGSHKYLIAVDMTAFPAAAAGVEALPANAQGNFYTEILNPADIQPINAPAGINFYWIVNEDAGRSSPALINAIKEQSLDGDESIFIAGEFKMVGDLRSYFRDEKRYPKDQLYISSYWKHGLIESEHKRVKTLVA